MTLFDLMNRPQESPVNIRPAVSAIYQAALGVSELHRTLHPDTGEPLVHRSLNPNHIHCSPLGLAKVDIPEWPHLPDEAWIPGNPLYFAPESFEDGGHQPSQNIFTLGVMLYEATTGQHPFTSSNSMATIWAIMGKDPEPPSALVPGFPPALEAIILKALRKDPAERYPSADALAQALLGHLMSATVPAGMALEVSDALAWLRQQLYEGRDDEVARFLQHRPDLAAEASVADYVWDHISARSTPPVPSP